MPTEVHTIGEYGLPLVTCLCITRQRPALLNRSIACFQKQTYPDRCLVVIAEETDQETIDVVNSYIRDRNIRLCLVDPTLNLTLGDLRNISVERADSEYLAQWDDDDFSHPDRLNLQMSFIQRNQIDSCALNGVVVLIDGKAVFTRKRPWESTLICKKSVLPPYPSLRRGEDTVVVDELIRRQVLYTLDRPELYLYVFHGSNTWDNWHFQELVWSGRGPAHAQAIEILTYFFEFENLHARPPTELSIVAVERLKAFESNCRSGAPYPAASKEGRGIVTVAGGNRYTICAWVLVIQLRRLNCHLPIEVWYLGTEEMDESTRSVFESVGNVFCINAVEKTSNYPMNHLSGWECKPYSIQYSRFQEVLFLDADNFPVMNPEFLFDTAEYKETGAIFWPDVLVMEPTRPIWHLLDIDFRFGPEIESGQLVIDTERCWTALRSACHLCEYGKEFWWSPDGGGVYGDKDLFRFAWYSEDRPFAIPACPLEPLDGYGVLCQHDFDGRRLFQHRTWKKWLLYGTNERVHDFWFESDAIRSIEIFRELENAAKQLRQSNVAICVARSISNQRYFEYVRVGFDRRPIEFLDNGIIGQGGGKCEQLWRVVEQNGHPVLQLLGEDGLLCDLAEAGQGTFAGDWLIHELMHVYIKPC